MANIDVNDKLKIQQLLDSNTVRAGGDFHSDSLDEDVFIYDINKNFKLTPKESGVESHELLEKIIKLSTVKVRGRFNSRELKQSKFIKELSQNFELERL
jgi:hypothetical protein